MSYPGATIKDYAGIKLGQLISFLQEVAEQEGDDCILGSPGSGGDSNLYRVKIAGRRGGKCFTLWMDEGYDENDQFDRDDGLLVKKKKLAIKTKKTTQKATPVIAENPSTRMIKQVSAPVSAPASAPASAPVPASATSVGEDRPYIQYNYMQYVEEIRRQQDRPIAQRKGRRACAKKPAGFYKC